MPPIRLLGPVGITGDDGPVAISSRRARTLLAALVLAFPRAVTPDRLAADVWPDKTPQNPAGALHTQISRLRTLLGTDAISVSAAGYRLEVGTPISDLTAAESISRSREVDGTGADAAMMTWWIGSPGADLPPGAVRDELTDRAQTAFRALQERDWRTRLTRDAAAVTGEIAAARAKLPLDEHLAALHMRAALASGDPNGALVIHAALSEQLADELGSDPGPEVAAAHSAALSYTPLPHTPAPPTDDYVTDGSQLAQLADALTQSRVVTVLGPGGIGKTRLVTEYIAAHSPPNVFIDLSGARNPDDITAAVSRALGRGTVPEQGIPTSLTPRTAGAGIAQLADAGAVVILDTCEHLPDEISQMINEICLRRDDLRVIATSRSTLAVADEKTVTLAPLSARGGAELVTRRARALRSSTRLDPTLLAELCTRLDGSPLALELAAAQLRYLSLADVVARVDARFALLSVPGSGRHHTLLDVVAASWDLLGPDARRALEVLSLFPAEVRINDALFFPGVHTAGLAQLCDHSLATVVEHPDGRTRYRITETVRDFTRDKIAETPSDAIELSAEFRTWARSVVDSVGTDVMAGRVTDAVARLDESIDAILGILESAAELSDADTAARLLPVVAWRVVRAGGYPHALEVSRIAARATPTADHLLGIVCAAILFIMSGQFREAARARSTLRRISAQSSALGPVSLAVDLLTQPPTDLPRTLAAAARDDDPLRAAIADIVRADIAEFVAATGLSQHCALHALVAAQRCGHPWLIATSRQRLGRGHILVGDRAAGAAEFARSAAEFAAIGFTEEATSIRVHQALALAPTDPETATELLDACLRAAGDSGRPFVATAHATLAQLRLADDPTGARRSADRAIEVIGAPLDGHSAYLHGVRAVILHHSGAGVEARAAAATLRVSLAWLVSAPTANLPALGAAAAAIAIVEGRGPTDPLTKAARAVHYRRDFTVIDLGPGPRSRRSALRAVLR